MSDYNLSNSKILILSVYEFVYGLLICDWDMFFTVSEMRLTNQKSVFLLFKVNSKKFLQSSDSSIS